MYRHAIVTRYLPPTDQKGARIKATALVGSLTIPYDHALDIGENHAAAAKALIRKWGWGKLNGRVVPYVGGELPNGDYSWVAQLSTIRVMED